MTKKGVSAISRVTSPAVGEKNVYKIVNWYPATAVLERDPAKVTWELFKKRSNGKFTTTNIRKIGRGDFTFGQAAAGHTYRLEAYRYRPEGGGLIITPTPAKILKINKVELFHVDDTKGSKFSFMEKLRAKAYCSNMLGKELVFTLWEDDAKGAGHNTNNQAIDTKKAKVNKEGVSVAEFTLTAALMRKAARGEMDSQLEFYVTVEYYTHKKHATDNVNIKNPYLPQQGSDQKQTTPKAQQSPAATKPFSKKDQAGIVDETKAFFAEVYDYMERAGTALLDKLPTFEKPEGKTPTIKQADEGTTATNEEKCLRCEKLSKEEVDQIFTTASEIDKNKLIETFNEANVKFEINTCLRKAHFFAQVLAEVGPALKLTEPESFNYSVRRLKGGDYVRGSNWINGNLNPKEGGYYSSGSAKDYKTSPFSYFKSNPQQAEAVGRKDLRSYNDKGIQAANSEAIANFVYADQNRGPKYKLGNVNPGDGWKFMGKGIIQVTGRGNYTEVNKKLERKGYSFDIVNNPNVLLQHKESVLSAMAFWYWKDLQLKSDKGGKNVVDSITKIVNEATDSYDKRKTNFEKVYSIFQVDKCSPTEKEVQLNTAKWRFPIDNPMLCLYSQGGGEKPWHGSFGENIRDGKGNHAGTDLLAAPGTTIYAGLKGKISRVYTSSSLAGRVVVVQVTDKKTFKSLRNDYKPLYKERRELLEKGFDHDGDIYFVFMHLSKFGSFREGDDVEHDSVIGYTGISGKNGNNFQTRNPHLHFEINNVGSAAGIASKCNPQVYFKFKTEQDMTAADKELQLEFKNKVWK